MNKIAVVGAGKTGRGFIGRLLSEANREILFIDKDEQLVHSLNEQGSFEVHFFGNCRPTHVVSGYKAVTWADADLTDIDLILVSVGGMNLPDVGAQLARLMQDGKKRRIITAENASKPAKKLLDVIGEDKAMAAESTVFCTTIEDGGLDIASENYPYLQCDAQPLGGDFDPQVAGIRPIDNFGNFLTRKLYTYNAASCVIAYLGYIKGYTDYGEAANDPEILELLDRNYAATNEVLCKVFGYTVEDQREFAALSKQKFCDRTIVDTVARNAREPQRKLQHGERVVGPLQLLVEHGADAEVLIHTAAAMLLYTDPKETEWNAICAEKTPAEILCEIGGLPIGDPVAARILDAREQLLAYRDGKREKLL